MGGWIDIGEPRPEYRVFIVPRSDYQIDDNSWNTFGLQGTGSKDLVFDKVFVPDYRTHVTERGQGGGAHSADAFPSDVYKYPFGTLFSTGVGSDLIGMGLGALDVFQAGLISAKASFSGAALATDGFLVEALAYADSEINSALAQLDRIMAELDADIAAGIETPVSQRAQYMSYMAQMGVRVSDAVVDLYRRSGARALSDSHDMQQFLRDCLAGCNHITMDTVHMGANAGAVRIGAPNQVPIL